MVDTGLAPREGTPEPQKQPPTHEEILTSIMYAKALERFHCLDGLKDGFCPCCGAPVDVEDNGHGTGVRIKSRW